MHRIIGYPHVGRFGLAHSLLAWARCHVWCRRHGLDMLAPNWFHLRIGPYLRQEIDKRAYHRLFEFPDYITGVRRACLLTALPKIAAESTDLNKLFNDRDGKLVVFSNRVSGNEDHHFHEIVGDETQVRAALVRMTKPQYLAKVITAPHIAIHIRMGDFTEPKSMEDLRKGTKNSRIPVIWYADMLREVRRRFGTDLPSILYSDGPSEALAPLLDQAGVRRAPAAAAITDLLSISNAALLISSGSGFSFWGSYLGHVPRICFPGQRLFRVLGEPNGVDEEPECESAEKLPPEFFLYLKAASVARNEGAG